MSKTKMIWNQIAKWWDDSYQEGDLYHRTFLFPTLLEWVAAKKGMRILDIGCGNGALARRFAEKGAELVAVDFSEVFIEKAKERSQGFENIVYHIIDATDIQDLNALINMGPFDRVVSSMVLHDMPTIQPLAFVLPKLLKPEGKFIFTVPHPCFNSGLVEIERLKKHMENHEIVLTNRYIRAQEFEILSKPGQPLKQLSYHRPLSVLFKSFFDVGLIMSNLAEPVAKSNELLKDFLWAKLSDIPPALICEWEMKIQCH